MSEYHEAHGSGLKERREQKKRAELNHLRICSNKGASPERMGWTVEHHTSAEGDEWPETHVFEDGHEMLAHVANHAAVEPGAEGEEFAGRE